MRVSITSLLSILFIVYVIHSMWTLSQLFIPPKCEKEPCLDSYFNTNPSLNLILYTSEYARPTMPNAKQILHLKDFNFNDNFEK